MQMTNSNEAAAFFLARAIVVAAMFYVAPHFLGPLYSQLVRQGGRELLPLVVYGVSAVTWVVTLVLFLAFRAAFGGTPAIVAPSRQRQVTSSGGEIGAYVATAALVTIVLSGFNTLAMPYISATLRESGRADLQLPVSLTVSIVSAALFFLIFIALRSAMSRPPAGTNPFGPPP